MKYKEKRIQKRKTSNIKPNDIRKIMLYIICLCFMFFIFNSVRSCHALPPSSQARFSMARRLFEKQQVIKARQVIKELLKNHPESESINSFFKTIEKACLDIALNYIEMAENEYKDNNFQEALNFYQEALKYNPGNKAALKGKKAAMSDYKNITISSGINSKRSISPGAALGTEKRSPKVNQILIHYKLATRYLKNKAYDNAIKEFEIVLDLDPSNAGARSMLKKLKHDNETYRPYTKGVALYKKKQYKEALKELSPIYSWNQNFLDITFYMGCIYHYLNNHKMCLQLLGQYINGPHNLEFEIECHILRASSYLKLFESSRALYEYALAWSKSPEFFNMFNTSSQADKARRGFNLAWLLTFKWIIIMGIAQIALMISIHTASVRFFKLASGQVLPRLLIQAKKLHSQGKHKKALKYYKQASALAPQNPSIFFSMGLIYNLLHRASEAIDNFEIVLKLKPDNLRASYNLAMLYHNSAMYKESITILRTSMDVDLKVICPGAEFDDIISNKILYEQTFTKLLFLFEQKMEAQQIM